MTPLLAFLALSPRAAAQEAWSSEPRALVFSDVHEVFSVFTFDTGYLPSVNDPISVRFHVTPQGGVITDLEATSLLVWGLEPETLEHTVEAVPGSGWFGVDSTIDLGAEVHLDILGLYTGSIPLWSEQIVLSEGAAFDTLLLDGSGEAVEISLSDTSLVDPLEYELTVFTGLDLLLTVEVYPELVASITGDRVDTAFAHAEVSQIGEGEWTRLAPPEGQPAGLALTSTWVADLTSRLNLVIEPSVSLDTFLGAFELVSFPIPVDLVDASELKPFAPVFTSHPLPAVVAPPERWDFGDVEVGGLANWPMVWENVGALGLEGTARVEGQPADDDAATFTVWPEYLYATDDMADGLVVSFAPKLEGPQEAWLVIESNDPAVAEIRVLLTGNGYVEPSPSDRVPDLDPDDSASQVSSCGCQSAGGAAWIWLLVPLLMRRRTNFTRR